MLAFVVIFLSLCSIRILISYVRYVPHCSFKHIFKIVIIQICFYKMCSKCRCCHNKYSKHSYKRLEVFKVLLSSIYKFFRVIFSGTVRGLEGLGGRLDQSGHHGGLDRLNGIQTMSFEGSLNPRKKRSLPEPSRVLKGLLQRCPVVFRHKLTDVPSGANGSIGMMKHPGSGDILSHTEDPFFNLSRTSKSM